MKSKRINYFKYFNLFFAITILVFITGCTGAPPTAPNINCLTTIYNGNGSTAGIVPIDPASPYESGATVTVLGNTGDLIRINAGGTSYRFTGWNTKADGSGAYHTEGSTFIMGASNVTLYAQWTPYVLRDTGPAGGYIFYDKGYYSKADFTIVKAAGNGTVPINPTYDAWRYLEAAPASTEWKNKWGSYETFIGGTEKSIGAGKSNTTIIVTWLNSHGETGKAAQLCDALVYGGYSDWFLPSKDELNLMYINLEVAGVGGFAGGFYWSSSEYNAYSAWLQDYGNGFQGSYGKYGAYRVRAVRVF